MAWRIDKDPIEYLEQRVRYYKNKQKQFKKFLGNPDMTDRFGREMIETGINQIGKRIVEFESAITILKMMKDI